MIGSPKDSHHGPIGSADGAALSVSRAIQLGASGAGGRR